MYSNFTRIYLIIYKGRSGLVALTINIIAITLAFQVGIGLVSLDGQIDFFL